MLGYGAQVKGIVYSHIRRVHLGVALGCRFSDIHMQSVHPQEPKFEPLVLPENIKAEPVESEVQITEERFEIPTPKHLLKSAQEAEVTKRMKQELSESQALQELAKSDEGHSYAFQSTRAHPQSAIAAIRYRREPSVASQVATALVMQDIVDIECEDELLDKEDKPSS